MNAKEYSYKDYRKILSNHQRLNQLSIMQVDLICDAMDELNRDIRAKSQKEAEERYVIARDNIIKQLGGISIFLKMQLRIASGKEEG